MRILSLLIIALLLGGALGFGQSDASQQRPTLGQAPGGTQNRPTLGPGAPSLNGPLTATVMDPHRLRLVRTVYVGMMDNSLNTKLISDFAKHGPFRAITNRNTADAILQATCFNSPHLKEVHTEVFLTGRDGKSIWQDVIHEPYNPPPLSKAVSETAALIVAHLRASIEAAGRR